MSNKDDRIEEEIRRRALERKLELESEQEQKLRQEANLKALEEVAELTREELERIDREVREELFARQGRRKKLVRSGMVGGIIALCVALWLISNQGRQEEKEPVSLTPPAVQPQDTPSVRTSPAPSVKKSLAPAEKPLIAVPAQSGPILPKPEAEEVLKAPLLECLQESEHYTMIVRIGQRYQAESSGPLAPLLIVNDQAIIDYLDIDNFTATPLGTCIAKAALEVRTRAFKGDYMYFNITNDAVPDPLAHAAKTIDRKEAASQLSALDEEARECALRHPEYAEPGKTISLSIRFRGVDGVAREVVPFYVKDSPYRSCLEKAYEKAKVSPFRRLNEKVMHQLAP